MLIIYFYLFYYIMHKAITFLSTYVGAYDSDTSRKLTDLYIDKTDTKNIAIHFNFISEDNNISFDSKNANLIDLKSITPYLMSKNINITLIVYLTYKNKNITDNKEWLQSYINHLKMLNDSFDSLYIDNFIIGDNVDINRLEHTDIWNKYFKSLKKHYNNNITYSIDVINNSNYIIPEYFKTQIDYIAFKPNEYKNNEKLTEYWKYIINCVNTFSNKNNIKLISYDMKLNNNINDVIYLAAFKEVLNDNIYKYFINCYTTNYQQKIIDDTALYYIKHSM